MYNPTSPTNIKLLANESLSSVNINHQEYCEDYSLTGLVNKHDKCLFSNDKEETN